MKVLVLSIITRPLLWFLLVGLYKLIPPTLLLPPESPQKKTLLGLNLYNINLIYIYSPNNIYVLWRTKKIETAEARVQWHFFLCTSWWSCWQTIIKVAGIELLFCRHSLVHIWASIFYEWALVHNWICNATLSRIIKAWVYFWSCFFTQHATKALQHCAMFLRVSKRWPSNQLLYSRDFL